VSAGELCLLDGRIVPLAEARISPLDRGFLFGDSVYEAIKLLDGKLLFLDRHLARLERSLDAMRVARPAGLASALAGVVAAAGLARGVVYLQITRGAAARRSHLPAAGMTPTVFALPIAIEFAARPDELPGLTGVTRRDIRWRHRDVKTTALAASVMATLAAADAGADEPLWLAEDGALREGGHTNLFVRDAEGWHTHPLGPQILSGVTRAVILEEARRSAPPGGVALSPLSERAPRLAARDSWREAFVCGTTTGVRGLVALDGAAVADGEVGGETRELARRLAAAERREAQRLAGSAA